MRRVALLFVALALIAGCAVRSDRVTPLVSIPTGTITDAENVGVGECLVTVGPAQGVRIQSVDDSGPSVGIVQVGDVITSFGGVPTLEATDLVGAVRSHGVGETVPFVAIRNGDTLDLEVTLSENPTLAGSPRMGVEGLTVNDQMRISALPVADARFEGALTRVVDIGNEFLLFDPVGIRWARLGLDASADRAFSVIGSEIYLVVADVNTLVVTVTATSTSRTVTLETGDWQPVRLLPPLDGFIVLGAQRPDATRSQGVETAIIAVDPDTGALQWSLSIDDQTSGSILPSLGFRDPYSERIEVELIPLDGVTDTSTFTHVLVTPTPDGGAEAALTVGIPDTSTTLGWTGENRLLWGVGTLLYATDPRNGLTDPISLATGETVPSGQWPVGDDAHVLAFNGASLLLVDIDGTAVRQLTESCPTPGISGPGWGISN